MKTEVEVLLAVEPLPRLFVKEKEEGERSKVSQMWSRGMESSNCKFLMQFFTGHSTDNTYLPTRVIERTSEDS